MADYSGTIIFEREQQEALIELSYAPGFMEVQDFAAVLHTMTTANITRCTFTQGADMTLDGTGGDIPDPSFAAHFKLKRTDPMADVRYKSFRMPAPKIEIFDHLPGIGYRIKQSYGDTLAAALSTLCDEEFIFDSGWLVD
jgi:hypothetical protein